MIKQVLLLVSLLLFATQAVYAQVRPPWTLTVSVIDIYEDRPVCDAEVKVFLNGHLVDSGMTGAAGVVQFIVDFSATLVEEVTSHDVVLLPAYPNPFIGKTTVPFSLERFTQVTAGVFDLLGRQVTYLEYDLAAGNHEMNINLSDQPPGMYFLRLHDDEGVLGTSTLVNVGSGGGQSMASLSVCSPLSDRSATSSFAAKTSSTSSTDYEIEVSKGSYDTGTYYLSMRGDTDFTARLLIRDTNTIGMEFIRIPAGTFRMGDITGVGDWRERPVHLLTLTRDFFVGKYEVTQVEYKAVLGQGSYIRPCGFSGDDRLPRERVSWYETIRFANTLSVSEGYAPCYDNDGNVIGGEGNPYACEGYRLPTEAEWEYAARAGTTTIYSFGDDESEIDNYSWCRDSWGLPTHPVGEKLPNPWGLHDVHCNVWEWVYDWRSETYYSISPLTDPTGPHRGEYRVLRGGWRSADRNCSYPTHYDRYSGFRLARTAK